MPDRAGLAMAAGGFADYYSLATLVMLWCCDTWIELNIGTYEATAQGGQVVDCSGSQDYCASNN
jgi:hypothetical protein